MKAILSAGALLALCERPRYVKRNPESGAYVEAEEAEAEGLAVGGDLYNLPGGTAIPDAPEAIVSDMDGAELIFQNRAHIGKVEASTGAAVISIEEALCDLDETATDRLAAVEEALCELDNAVNGGGEI